ncbi:MAG: RNase P subunit [Thaumarchaeota archaeon]|nr:RNase P subunit [Nitrososphaerota archaeon]
MKPYLKKIVLERMQILIDNAVSNAKNNPILSERQAMLARRLSSRHKIRMPYNMRILFCKKCKSFITPGTSSRIRVGRAPVRAIRVSCCLCGHIYRKILPK